MKKRQQFLITLVAVLFAILSACGNSSDETNNKPSDTNSVQEDKEDTPVNETDATKDPAESTEGSQPNDQDQADGNESATPEQENPVSSDKEPLDSKKQEYLKKLDATQKEAEKLKPTDKDITTVVLKKKAEDRLLLWDGLLNDIYGVLKSQLPAEEMKALQIEQRKWITYRDNTALEASYKYKGGTAEHLEYLMVLGNLTEERCYELVNTYMK